MSDFVYFKKGSLDFINSYDEICVAPSFVEKASKNYRYDLEQDILEKQCIACKRFFPVQKRSEGQYYDIHNEEDIHFIGTVSGYSVRCKECTGSEPAALPDTSVNDSFTVPLLTIDNANYVKLLCIMKSYTEEEALNFIITIVKKHNPITYTENLH